MILVACFRIGLSVIQRNIRRWLTLRNWEWWLLYTRVKPLLCIARAGDDIKKKEEELEKIKEQLMKVEKLKKELEEQNVGLLQTKNDLFLQLRVGSFSNIRYAKLPAIFTTFIQKYSRLVT